MENNNFSLTEDLMTIFWLWKELIIIILAIIIGVLSFKYNGILNDQSSLFSRTGSILVLLAAINEYRLQSLRYRQLGSTRKFLPPKVFLGQRILSIFTHLLVIIGTIIWGFGDLFIKYNT